MCICACVYVRLCVFVYMILYLSLWLIFCVGFTRRFPSAWTWANCWHSGIPCVPTLSDLLFLCSHRLNLNKWTCTISCWARPSNAIPTWLLRSNALFQDITRAGMPTCHCGHVLCDVARRCVHSRTPQSFPGWPLLLRDYGVHTIIPCLSRCPGFASSFPYSFWCHPFF
jgi:hypothetical protein